MPKFSEDTLNSWRMPPSDAEETKLANAERMVKEAIVADQILNKLSIDTFGQGSYANDTNVKLDSDVDINVCLSSTIYYDLPTGKTKEDFGYKDSSYKFVEYKNSVEQALVNKFGRASVVRKDKCITVLANTYRVETDVVPTFEYRRHNESGTTTVGVKFISDANKAIINYPLQHIENGKTKNTSTQKRFKRLTRIYRRIRYRMIDDGIAVSDNITSFLLECLVWNVPDNIFNGNDTWTERLRQSIIHLYHDTKEQNTCNDWGEVSDQIYLLRGGRKWSREDVNKYLQQMWTYLEFK